MEFQDMTDDQWIKEHSPIDPRKLHALGYISLAWNQAENFLHAILGELLGLKHGQSAILTSEVGSVRVCKQIEGLMEISDRDPRVLEVLGGALKYFEMCRKNRNQLTHFQLTSGDLGGEGLRISRARSKKPMAGLVALNDTLENIRTVAEDIDQLRNLLAGLYMALWDIATDDLIEDMNVIYSACPKPVSL